MSRYDGLIIPRSYSEYINKTDAATLSQALALPGVMDAAPTENSNKAARSGGIYNAIDAVKPVDTVALNNMHSVTSNAVARVLGKKITNFTVGKGYVFNGTVVKIGKIVFVDGKVINSIHSNGGSILSNLPINVSEVSKDQNVWWLSNDWTSIVGYSILSFDNGNTSLAIGIGSAPVGSAQISFSYISE